MTNACILCNLLWKFKKVMQRTENEALTMINMYNFVTTFTTGTITCSICFIVFYTSIPFCYHYISHWRVPYQIGWFDNAYIMHVVGNQVMSYSNKSFMLLKYACADFGCNSNIFCVNTIITLKLNPNHHETKGKHYELRLCFDLLSPT